MISNQFLWASTHCLFSLPKGIIRNYNLIINEKNFYDQPVNSDIKQYESIYLFIYLLFLVLLNLTTQAVHIYTSTIATQLKIVSILINFNWKIVKNNRIKSPIAM